MEDKMENRQAYLEKYIKEIEQRLYQSNTLQEIKDLKEEVVPVYVEEYNKRNLNGSNLAKVSNLITKIQTKENELRILKIAEDNVKMMKEYAELLENMEKAYNALNKKEE